MTYALLALVIVLVLLTIVMAWLLIEVLHRVDWLKDVLIPFMTSLTRFINPCLELVPGAESKMRSLVTARQELLAALTDENGDKPVLGSVAS